MSMSALYLHNVQHRHARTRPSIGNNMLSTGNAVDPHSLFADPDPAVLLNADPDSAS